MSKSTKSLLRDWRDERAFRVARTISWAGLILGTLATAVDISFKMPVMVLVGDAYLLSGCAIAIYYTKRTKRILHLIWAPLYFGVWVATSTSLFSSGGINSPFFGGYLALLFVGGLIIQSQIKPIWVVLFTLLNLISWFLMEVIWPGKFGTVPPLFFNFLINGMVVAALMVYVYEFLRTESNLAGEIIQRYRELDKARESVVKEENANAAKSAFLANISHELRTPLGAILGYAELLQDPQTSLSERSNYSETILRNGQQLSRLVDDLLDLAKVEAGKIEFENIEFNTAELFEETVDMLVLPARKKMVQLNLTFPSPIPQNVISDPLRIKQILLNLIGNAIKFTDRGEINIRVFYQQDASQFRVEIQDTGKGLTAEEQAKLFKPFSQADATVSRKFGGTGLGLSLSRNMARLLGGDLQLAWSQPGLGSEFVLLLPVRTIDSKLTVQNAQASIEETKVPQIQILAGVKVLLVDDTTDNQKLISLFLERTGASVELASDGVEAIQKVMQSHFDIVLMDVQMPVMDGLQAASILRQKNFQKPLIALTAHAMKEDRDRCLAAGFDDYLSKPVDRQLLVGKIKSIISQRVTNKEGRTDLRPETRLDNSAEIRGDFQREAQPSV